MTIDEAIAHEKRMAKERRYYASIENNNLIYQWCIEYAEKHEQYIEWLEELKDYREIGTVEGYKSAIECYTEEYNLRKSNVQYNKAIDDFANNVICELKSRHTDMPVIDILGTREKWKEKNLQYLECENLVYKIAEQLKEK